jgi:hypothetical protein
MKSQQVGQNTSGVELNITQHGIWLYVNDHEYFLSYDDYPFFKDAKIKDIYQIELIHNTHLYWPILDIDLDIDVLENPERFPLISKQ